MSIYELRTSVVFLFSRNHFTPDKSRFMAKLDEAKIRWILHEKLRGRATSEIALIQ